MLEISRPPSAFEAASAGLRRRLLVRLSDESGIALVMALGIMLVLTIVLTSTIYLTSASGRHANRSNAGEKAYSLAEAGVNNAVAVLNASYPDSTNAPPGNRCLLRPQPVPLGFPGAALFTPDERAGCAALAGEDPITQYKPYLSTDPSQPGASVEWWGRIRWVDGMGATWIIVSKGSVPNPTGPGAANVVRQITAKVPIVSGTPEESDPGILNWVYSPTTTVFGQTVDLKSPFYVRGNLTVGNSSTITAPLYVTCVPPSAPKPTQAAPCGPGAGNVTLQNTAAILAPATLAIGGKLTLAGSGKAGSPGPPLPAAHIVNGCPGAPCAWGSGTNVFADPANRDYVMPDDPIGSPPTVDWPRWATYAAPGPMWGCDAATKTGNTPDFTSAAATFSLIQPTAYTCRVSIGSQIIGELSWDPNLGVSMGGSQSGQLTVTGTVYLPGNLDVTKFGGNDTVQYVGKGTIYVGGTISIKNVNLCATIANYNSGSGGNKWQCDTRPYASTDPGAWNTAQNALVLVAKGSGGALSAGNGIEVVSAQFQGVLAGEANLSITTSSTVEGPMISIAGTVSLNQSTGAAFPEIRFPPASTPGKPPPPLVLLAPREFSGG